jgi:hypothetical protein
VLTQAGVSYLSLGDNGQMPVVRLRENASPVRALDGDEFAFRDSDVPPSASASRSVHPGAASNDDVVVIA